MQLLNKIQEEFKLPQELFSKVKRAMSLNSLSKNYEDINIFIDGLPHKLK